MCHLYASLVINVQKETPLKIMWVREGPRISSRVKGVRPVKLTWFDNPEHFEGGGFLRLLDTVNWANSLEEVEIKKVEKMEFDEINKVLSKTQRLRCLRFYFTRFTGNIRAVKWPSSLTTLDLLGFSKSEIFGVEWPNKLKKLHLGSWCGCLSGVVFPDSLESLSVNGFSDSLPLSGVKWDGVKFLSLEYFDEYMDDSQGLTIEWPVGLEVLFLQKFNQPIDIVVWPKTLKHLYFGDWWDQPIVDVKFPGSLERLELGINFRGTLVGVKWPSSLKILYLGSFNSTLDGVVWPEALEELWMGSHFMQPIEDVKWPSSLKKIGFPSHFSHSVEGIRDGISVSLDCC